MAANMYRVGDYVYFETSATAPYQIRRIEELTKTPTGNVEAKVMCFYRRRDVSNTLVHLADKHQNFLDYEDTSTDVSKNDDSSLTDQQKHQLKHRELFLSRQVETLPATTIRGKCSVTLFNETESLLSYLNREDSFYYTLVYDYSQKTLLADKGQIRVGERFQAEIQSYIPESERPEEPIREELVWRPDAGLSNEEIDKYVLLTKAVGTFSRALDAGSAIRQPSLGLTAASASRDVTYQHALNMLFKFDHDLAKASLELVGMDGPVLCRDELEEWSPSEGNLFEEAMDKYGKDFHDIRKDFLPWKSMTAIVEYFYLWKTTDRCVQAKRLKAAEAERKLKQVYIPNYSKPNPAVLFPKGGTSERGCESCYSATSTGSQWFAWGPSHLQYRLCAYCWLYWKKYGGLKNPGRMEKVSNGTGGGSTSHRCTVINCDQEFRLRSHLLRHLTTAHHLDEVNLGSLTKSKAVKSMLMSANATTRLARKLCGDLLRPRVLARRPTDPNFDPKPSLKVFSARYKQHANPESLLKRSSGIRDRLSVKEFDNILIKASPQLKASVHAPLEILRRDLPTVVVKNSTCTFPFDIEAMQSFFRQLDQKKTAANSINSTPINSNGQLHNGPSILNNSRKRLQNGTSSKDCPPTKKPHLKLSGQNNPEEMYMCASKGVRKAASLTTDQIRKAARRPFYLVSGSSSMTNGTISK